MKKIFGLFLLCTTMMLSSCSTPMLALKSSYPITNSVETETTYNKVWGNVIDFFAMNNIPISVLEKDNGIIVAPNVSIGETLVTMEDEYGKAISRAKGRYGEMRPLCNPPPHRHPAFKNAPIFERFHLTNFRDCSAEQTFGFVI